MREDFETDAFYTPPPGVYEALSATLDALYGRANPMPTGAGPDSLVIPETGIGAGRVGELWAAVAAQSTALASPWMMGHMDTAAHPIAALTDAVVSGANGNMLFRELSPFASRIEEAMIAELATRLGLPAGLRPGFLRAAGRSRTSRACSRRSAAMPTLGIAPASNSSSRRRRILPSPRPRASSASRPRASSRSPATTARGWTHPHLRSDGKGPGRGPPDRGGGAWDDRDRRRGRYRRHEPDREDARRLVSCRRGLRCRPCVFSRAPGVSVRHRTGGFDLARTPEMALCAACLRPHPVPGPRRFRCSAGVRMPYSQGDAPHRGTWGLQGSRRADAVTLWVLLTVLGSKRLGSLVDDAIALTQGFHKRLQGHPSFEPVHMPDLNLQVFRAGEPDPDGQRLLSVQAEMVRRGRSGSAFPAGGTSPSYARCC